MINFKKIYSPKKKFFLLLKNFLQVVKSSKKKTGGLKTKIKMGKKRIFKNFQGLGKAFLKPKLQKHQKRMQKLVPTKSRASHQFSNFWGCGVFQKAPWPIKPLKNKNKRSQIFFKIQSFFKASFLNTE